MSLAKKLTVRLSTKDKWFCPRRSGNAGIGMRALVAYRRYSQWRIAENRERSDEVFGSLKVSGPPKTLEQMDAGVIAGARRRARD
jgi:hypothetical protein